MTIGKFKMYTRPDKLIERELRTHSKTNPNLLYVYNFMMPVFFMIFT